MAGRAQQPAPQESKKAFRFRTGVELINVTATVTDGSGRFVPGLRKEDFRVYQDDQPQTITHFNSERVPVSLGIILDTSGSMDGEKMAAAKQALNRFLLELLGPEDEVFLYRFDSLAELVHEWTTDAARQRGARPAAAARRHGDVRRGRRSDSARAGRQAPEEGAASSSRTATTRAAAPQSWR